MIDFNGIPINIEEIIDFLKQEMLLKEICERILSQKVIEQVARERNLTATPEEIQAEVDSIRYGMRLEKASDTINWLTEQMVTVEEWEASIRNRLLTKKLAQYLFDKEVGKFFAQNRLDFDQFALYQIIVPYEQLAQELFYQIEEEEISFYQAAHLYDIDERRRYNCGYEGKVHRWSFQADIAEVIFGAPVGTITGPLKTDRGYHIFMIEEFISAELTPETRQEIINRLFKEWLQAEMNYRIYSPQSLSSEETPASNQR